MDRPRALSRRPASRPGGRADVGVAGERADTIMLVHVPEVGGEAFVVSVRRDTWVPIPGVGEAKVDAALDLDAAWIAGTAPDLAGLSAGDLRMATAPDLGLGMSADGQSVVVPDLEAMAGIGTAVSAEDLGGYLATLSPDDQ